MLSRPKPSSENYKHNSLLLFFATTTALLAGCAGSSHEKSRSELCAERFAQVEEGFSKEKYWKIQEPMELILKECHGTGFMERTQYYLAESHFHLEEWIEARGEYTTFLINFPSSPFAETAAFKKAMSSYNMSYSDMRDDSPTQTAIRDFSEFINSYPNSGLLDSALDYQHKLTDRLAEKDFQIARLYWRMDEPQATAIYLKHMLSQYPQTARRLEAVLMLIDSYIRIEQFEQAETFLAQLQSSYPDQKEAYQDRVSDLGKAKESWKERLAAEREQKVLDKDNPL